MEKFALLSHVLPPSPSGQAVALNRILEGFDPDSFCLITCSEFAESPMQSREDGFLGAKSFFLPRKLTNKYSFHLLKILQQGTNLFQEIWQRAHQVKNILMEENCSSLIACSGDLVDIPAGFLASLMSHKPFYVYMFDDYVFQWTGKSRHFATLVAPFIFRFSSGMIGPNEYICEEYKRRYGIRTILIRNPCDFAEFIREPYQQWPSQIGVIKIIYTGAVYHANLDCFIDLIQVMEKLDDKFIELHIFTAQTKGELEIQGVTSNKVFIHSHLPYSEIQEYQHKADILFLPLAFKSLIPKVIRTSAPGKMGEYLACRRPILVYVPSNTYVADYFKKNLCGCLVDQNNLIDLKRGIEKIIENDEFRNEITKIAYQKAGSDFLPKKNSLELERFLIPK